MGVNVGIRVVLAKLGLVDLVPGVRRARHEGGACGEEEFTLGANLKVQLAKLEEGLRDTFDDQGRY